MDNEACSTTCSRPRRPGLRTRTRLAGFAMPVKARLMRGLFCVAAVLMATQHGPVQQKNASLHLKCRTDFAAEDIFLVIGPATLAYLRQTQRLHQSPKGSAVPDSVQGKPSHRSCRCLSGTHKVRRAGCVGRTAHPEDRTFAWRTLPANTGGARGFLW